MRQRRRQIATEWLRSGQSLSSVQQLTVTGVIDFFEDLGAQLIEGYIETRPLWSGFATPILHYWALCQDRVIDMQRVDSAAYGDFKELNKRMMEFDSRERNIPLDRVAPGEADQLAFMRLESQL